MSSLLDDPRVEGVLRRLYAMDRAQTPALVLRYLPTMLARRLLGRPLDLTGEEGFMRDKLIAIDRSKGELAYLLCRTLDARRVVEVGTSYGVSTLYLAAALRDAGVGSDAGKVIGTEIEPAKAARAQAHLAEAGLAGQVEIRVGDARETLRDVPGPIDFVLMDTWIPLARPVIELLAPQLRCGAVIMCDNVQQYAREYRDYTDFVRGNGFRSMLWPTRGGVELTLKAG